MKQALIVAFSYGLLRSWCWFTFVEGTADSVLKRAFPTGLESVIIFSFAGSLLAVFPGVFILKRAARTPKSGERIFAFFALALMIWLTALYFIPHEGILEPLAAASSSAGMALLTLLAAAACCSMTIRTAAVVQCAVSCVSILFLLPYMFMNETAGAIYVFALLPLGAAVLLSRAEIFGPSGGPGVNRAADSEFWDLSRCVEPCARQIGRGDWLNIARYACLSVLINLCCGTLQGLMTSVRSEAYGRFYYISNASYFAFSALLWWILNKLPEMRYKKICAASIPMICAGFILFPLLEKISPVVPFLLIQAGFAFFNVYEWTYILSIAKLAGPANALAALGGGWFLWVATSFVGFLLPDWILSFIETAVIQYPVILSTIGGISLCVAWGLIPDDILPDAPPSRDEKRRQQASYSEYSLTNQEQVVIGLLLKQMTNSEICASLNVAESTLRTHLKSIYRKTGAHSREELTETFTIPLGNSSPQNGESSA
jgi:DNA-binding CsgD family transcriptional regulator